MLRHSGEQTISADPYKPNSSSSIVGQIDFYAYVSPAGLLGRLIGRCLRFRVERYRATVKPPPSSSTTPSDPLYLGLQRVEIEAESLHPDYEVYTPKTFSYTTAPRQSVFSWRGGSASTSSSSAAPEGDRETVPPHLPHETPPDYTPRLALTFAEIQKVRRRTFSSSLLDIDRFPQILFEVTSENASSITGDLYLRGLTQTVQCEKYHYAPPSPTGATEDGLLRVRCPIKIEDYQMTKPALWLGVFTVKPIVEIEVRIPKTLLHGGPA